MKNKKIGIFTGSRSEYYLLQPVIEKLNSSKNIDLTLFVSGSHLDKKFTTNLDKELSLLNINYIKIPIPKNSSDLYSNGSVIGKAVSKFSELLSKISIDALIIYGDRYESFAAMIASSQCGVFTFHIEGGDITNGTTFDDNARHAMSKLANYHFVTNIQAKNVLIQMGENKKLIECVGLPINDKIYKNQFTQKDELISKYDLKSTDCIVIFTLHPEPLSQLSIDEKLSTFENVFKSINKINNLKILASYPNSDIGSEKIIKKLNIWSDNFNNFFIYKSFGSADLHGLFNLKNTTNKKVIFLGNSSSGLKETIYFNCPNLSYGKRQTERLSGFNTTLIDNNSQQIIKAINRVLKNYNKNIYSQNIENPYYFGNVSSKIENKVKSIDFDSVRLNKIFVKL